MKIVNIIKRSTLVFLVISISLLVSIGSDAQENIINVRVGVAPYSMFVIWIPAHELGIDKEFGINFNIQEFTATLPATQSMIRGDIDIVPSCHAEHIAVLENAPQVITFSSLDLFKGFIFIGRKNEMKSIEELTKEFGPQKAKEVRLNEFKGKKFCIIPQRKPLIADTIAQVGLTLDDVTLLNFADDQKAAMAFMKGEGDIYIGSLPQERRLLEIPDQYVNLGGSEILGPAGLWYGNVVTTDRFISNRETALRTLAAMYRLIRLFDEQPRKVAEIASEALSRMTGGGFSVDEYIVLETEYDDLLSIEDCLTGYYNSFSPLFWKNPVDYYIKMSIEQGDLKKEVTSEEYYGDSIKLFFELLSRQDLMEKIYAPF
jgi:ABC-type nitrate/sulfonate/bicarbonate transport system substrate-binding protein